MSYYRKYNKTCQYCGDYSYCYELCRDCYEMANNDEIIKNEYGEWVENIIKGNEYKFYDENKEYYIKDNYLNDYEMRLYKILYNGLSKEYTTIPQVNLQSIIETDTYTRNDELFRNIDFGIFNSKTLSPILMIELNGNKHYTNEYWIQRDISVKNILNNAELPLFTLKIDDFENISDKEILILIKKILSYINNSKNYKLNLNWTENYINKLNKGNAYENSNRKKEIRIFFDDF